MIRPTSLEAYEEVKGHLGSMQELVLSALEKLKVASNWDIANYLKMPINSITPRCLELRSLGIVEYAFTSIDQKTKRKVMMWKVHKPIIMNNLKTSDDLRKQGILR
jgi:hypothetical protein